MEMEAVRRNVESTVLQIIADNTDDGGQEGDRADDRIVEASQISGDRSPSPGQTVVLSDSSPAKPNQMTAPSEIELTLAKQFAKRPRRVAMDLLPCVDRAEFAFFKATLTACPRR